MFKVRVIEEVRIARDVWVDTDDLEECERYVSLLEIVDQPNWSKLVAEDMTDTYIKTVMVVRKVPDGIEPIKPVWNGDRPVVKRNK